MPKYTSIDTRYPTKPGLEAAGAVSHVLKTASNEGQWGNLPINPWSMAEDWKTLLCINPNAGTTFPNTAASATVGAYGITVDSSGGASIGALWSADGLRLTNATGGANSDVIIASTMLSGTPGNSNIIASGDIFKGVIRLSVSNATIVGISFGVATSNATDLIGADPTDGVFFLKATGAATGVGRVVDNGGAGANSGTLVTLVANTEVVVSFEFQVGTTAATSSGAWYVDGTKTDFTAAQLTSVSAMLTTTAASLRGIVAMRSSDTTARNMTIAHAWIGTKRG